MGKIKRQVTTNVVTCRRDSTGLSLSDRLFAATTRTTGPSSFLLRLCLTRLHGGCRLRGLSARRTDPDFNKIAVPMAAVEDGDSPRIDSALRHQIIRRASNQHIRLSATAGSSGIDDDVSLRVR